MTTLDRGQDDHQQKEQGIRPGDETAASLLLDRTSEPPTFSAVPRGVGTGVRIRPVRVVPVTVPVAITPLGGVVGEGVPGIGPAVSIPVGTTPDILVGGPGFRWTIVWPVPPGIVSIPVPIRVGPLGRIGRKIITEI